MEHILAHPNAINDLKIHPTNPNLVSSASKDHSIRLWNLKSKVLIALFSGTEGHRDQVLTISFDMHGNQIWSGGMDHSIKIWNLDTPNIQDAIHKSEHYDNSMSQYQFDTVHESFPAACTRNIHQNYVDCIKHFGDLILSKVNHTYL